MRLLVRPAAHCSLPRGRFILLSKRLHDTTKTSRRLTGDSSSENREPAVVTCIVFGVCRRLGFAAPSVGGRGHRLADHNRRWTYHRPALEAVTNDFLFHLHRSRARAAWKGIVVGLAASSVRDQCRAGVRFLRSSLDRIEETRTWPTPITSSSLLGARWRAFGIFIGALAA